MKELLPVSEEILNAFVDGELESEERDYVLTLEATNTDVAKAICEVRRLKNLVKAASAEESEIGKIPNISFSSTRCFKISYVAASIVLAFTVIIFSISNQKNPDIMFATESTYLDRDSLLTAASKKQNLNLVLHLKSAEVKQTTKLLQVLESVLQTSARYQKNLQIEVVASGPGLHMLQKQSSVYTNKITAIGNKHKNVSFIACGNTLHNLQKKTGKKIQIVKQAMLVDSGPKWVKQRQEKGWAYILLSEHV